MEHSRIRQAGLKITLPRIKILDILETSGQRHLSAEDVYRRLAIRDEDIGLATVYRVLTQFEDAGLVCRHRFANGQAVFELDRGGHHDHLICLQCHGVVEFLEKDIEDRQRAIARRHGFLLKDHSLVIYGICPRCRSDSPANNQEDGGERAESSRNQESS